MAKHKTSLGCLFWIALILLVLVVFFFNRQRITRVLEETGFSEYLSLDEEKEPRVERKTIEDEETSDGKQEEEPETQSGNSDKSGDTIEVTIEKEEKETEETSGGAEKPEIEKKLRKSTVYFVAVDEAGDISLKKIVRPVYFSDSPLTATMETLLKGLTPSELNDSLLNLIPENTRIHKIWVEDGVAFIDFSEDLKFNPFGLEGIKAALRQIVYTATEFSTVESVQILINGEKRSYIASEGLPIGTPLKRGDLSQ